MKKALTLILLMFIGIATVQAQKDVTTFLGIPVDGTKAAMRQKLIAKGFKVVPGEDCLKGEFNGEPVYITIQTVKNKVWRLCVWDQNNRTENQIIIRFNTLINQFENNPRYCYFEGSNTEIPENENLSYEISVKNKQYEACFFQAENEEDVTANKMVWFTIGKSLGDFHISMYYENGYNKANGQDL